jgi:hypothetical protein
MDVLVLGRHVLLKEQQERQVSEVDRKAHLAQYQPD